MLAQTWGLGLAAVLVALASSFVLVATPAAAIVLAPLVYLVLDTGVASMLGLPGPRWAIRVFGRVVAAASAAIALRIATTLGASSRGTTMVGWLLPATAIVLTLGWTFAAISGHLAGVRSDGPAPTTRAERGPMGAAELAQQPPLDACSDLATPRAAMPLADGTLILAADVVTASIAFTLSLMAHERPLRAALVATAALCGAMLARALIVATIAHRALEQPTSGLRATMAFVLWLGLAGFAIALARHPVAWSGAGAAALLTLAAIARKSHRARPSAVAALGRATVGWSVAALLAVLTLLAAPIAPTWLGEAATRIGRPNAGFRRAFEKIENATQVILHCCQRGSLRGELAIAQSVSDSARERNDW